MRKRVITEKKEKAIVQRLKKTEWREAPILRGITNHIEKRCTKRN